MNVTLKILFLVIVSFACAQGATIVFNGGFETGDFTGWAITADPAFTEVNGNFVNSGVYAAELGEFDSVGTLNQVLPTSLSVEYYLQFWLQNEGGTPNSFTVWWNGSPVASLTDLDGFDYSVFTIGGLFASSASTLLEFRFQHISSFWHLDDVLVEPVPEPATGVGMLVVLAGAYLARRRLAKIKRPWSGLMRRSAGHRTGGG